MTQQHTEGRLQILWCYGMDNSETPHDDPTTLVPEGRISPHIAYLPELIVDDECPAECVEEHRYNAERLCKCWNAFAGTSGDPETLLANLLSSVEGVLQVIDDYGLVEDKDVCTEQLRAALSPFVGKKETQGE